MFDDQLHQDVILVKDSVLAAALFARDHYALMTYQDMNNNFFSAFAITHRLRKDIRLYYGGNLAVDARKFNNELAETNMYLGDYECYIHSKLGELEAKQN